jgi:hypothetical protein
MKPTLADQLKEVKLDTSTYSRLPIREDVLVMDKDGLLKQWEKLLYLQKHLRTINWYIHDNKGEVLGEWLKNKKQGLSNRVISEIGNHNNKTGGITVYFLNLQNFYDKQEELYDKQEEASKLPGDMQTIIFDLRKAREEKRKTRREMRKIRLRDLKKDGKGYLSIVVEEPKAPEDVKEESKRQEPNGEQIVEAVKKTRKNIGIWIAGTVIVVGAIVAIANAKK